MPLERRARQQRQLVTVTEERAQPDPVQAQIALHISDGLPRDGLVAEHDLCLVDVDVARGFVVDFRADGSRITNEFFDGAGDRQQVPRCQRGILGERHVPRRCA